MEIYAKGMSCEQLNEAVRRCTDERIDIRACNGQRFIACAGAGRSINVYGVAGNGAGAYMESGELRVYGNAQDALADTMGGGEIYVFGGCGDAAGYAMRGGEVYVRDNAGYRAGVHMKAYDKQFPVLVVGGRAGCFLGEYLAGGIIAVLDLHNEAAPLGEEAARGMHGGRIYVRGEVGVPLPECTAAPGGGGGHAPFGALSAQVLRRFRRRRKCAAGGQVHRDNAGGKRARQAALRE